MGGRGSVSASKKSLPSVEEQAYKLAADEYDKYGHAGGIGDQIPNWIIDRKFTSIEKQGWNVGDTPYVKKETEKALLVVKDTDYGQLDIWVPKSVLITPEQHRADFINNEVGLHIAANYQRYLMKTAEANDVKLGKTRKTDKIKQKLTSKGIDYMDKEKFKKSTDYSVIDGNLLWTWI